MPQQHCTGCPCAKRGRACRPTPACLRLGGTISSSPRHQPSNPTWAYFPSDQWVAPRGTGSTPAAYFGRSKIELKFSLSICSAAAAALRHYVTPSSAHFSRQRDHLQAHYHALMQHKLFCKISFDPNHAASSISLMKVITLSYRRCSTISSPA